MTKRLIRLISLAAALLALFSCIETAAGEAAPYTLPQPSILPEDRVLPPEEGWEPPVIDPDAVKDTEPWMLVIKIAQEELGYTEGPKKDESKYGEWYAGKLRKLCEMGVVLNISRKASI